MRLILRQGRFVFDLEVGLRAKAGAEGGNVEVLDLESSVEDRYPIGSMPNPFDDEDDELDDRAHA